MPTTYKSRRIGRLDLEINENKEIASYTWQSTVLDERYEGNKEIEALVKSVKVGPQAKAKRTSESKLNVYIFQSPDCKECINISRTVLAAIEEKYKDRINIEYLDTTNPATYERMMRLEKIYNVRGGIVPEVFFARYALIGSKQIRLNLDKMLEKTLASGNFDTPISPEPYQPPGSLILERFKRFSFYTVGIAGLLDGINPCAFTTLVFFISFLGFMGYRRSEVIWAGSSFASAVFITYLLLGLGIFKAMRSLRAFSSIALTLNIIIALFAILLGILNLYDYYKIKKTKDPTSAFLKLPQSIKATIHSVIGKDFRNREGLKKSLFKLLSLGLLTGFLISILESICTGQVYLPTIAFVTRMTDLKGLGFLYLIYYNLAFIIPLLIVFCLALFGTTSVQFARFVERHIKGVKLGTAFLFFFLASILLILR